MNNISIREYLNRNNYIIHADNGVHDIFNLHNDEIIDSEYDPLTSIMTIRTANETFSFLWVLGKPFEHEAHKTEKINNDEKTNNWRNYPN